MMSQHIRRDSPEYDALVSYISGRLTTHRNQLESTSIPLDKVPELRARIAELKTLLSQLTEDYRNEQS